MCKRRVQSPLQLDAQTRFYPGICINSSAVSDPNCRSFNFCSSVICPLLHFIFCFSALGPRRWVPALELSSSTASDRLLFPPQRGSCAEWFSDVRKRALGASSSRTSRGVEMPAEARDSASAFIRIYYLYLDTLMIDLQHRFLLGIRRIIAEVDCCFTSYHPRPESHAQTHRWQD